MNHIKEDLESEGLGSGRREVAGEAINADDAVKQAEQAEVRQMENKSDTLQQPAPIFASFAGKDLLGMGLRKTFKAGKYVGGSEWNNSARL